MASTRFSKLLVYYCHECSEEFKDLQQLAMHVCKEKEKGNENTN